MNITHEQLLRDILKELQKVSRMLLRIEEKLGGREKFERLPNDPELTMDNPDFSAQNQLDHL